MSTWITKSKDDIEYDAEAETIDVYLGSDYNGNNYISIPVEIIKELIP